MNLSMHAFCSASAAPQKLNMADGFPVRDNNGLVLIGLSVCWGASDAYYISLQHEQSKGTNEHVDTRRNTFKSASLSLLCLVPPQV